MAKTFSAGLPKFFNGRSQMSSLDSIAVFLFKGVKKSVIADQFSTLLTFSPLHTSLRMVCAKFAQIKI